MNKSSIIAIGILLTSSLLQTAGAIEPGTSAPNCALTGISDGQHYTLNQFRGKVVLVDFWASWCGPCMKSFGFFNQLRADLAAKGLHIVGVNLDEEQDEAHAFLARTPADFQVVKDDAQACAKQFAVKAMPSSYLIDKAGVVRHVQLGFREGETDTLRATLEKLLAEPEPGAK